MPSVSKKQHNFMAAVAKNPSFAKKVGVKPSVGEEFLNADKGKKFKEGGAMKSNMKMFEKSGKDVEKKGIKEGSKKDMMMDKMQMTAMKKGGMAKMSEKEDMAMDKKQDVAMIKKAFKQHDAQEHKGGKGTTLKLAKGGAFRSSANGIAQKGLTKGTQVKMCGGGMMGKKGK
jgi:hypothetical protein